MMSVPNQGGRSSGPKTPKTPKTTDEPIDDGGDEAEIDKVPEADIPGRPSTDDDREA